MMNKIIKMVEEGLSKITLKNILFGIFVFLLGALSYGASRFVLVKPDITHYHANFALYIDGKRDDFKSFTFYEEITACTASLSSPKSRVHMHNNENDVIHVHDEMVTWGHFFSNLGYVFADGLMKTNYGTFIDNDEKKFTYILNGEKVSSISERTINSKDALLINYGNEDSETIKDRYSQINKNAHEYNDKLDPSNCSGGSHESLLERLRRTQLQ